MEKSFLQQEAELSPFIDPRNVTVNDTTVVKHTSFSPVEYDPSHRDADWQGLVPKTNSKRRAVSSTLSQSSSYNVNNSNDIIIYL